MDPPSYDNAMSMPTTYDSNREPGTVAEQVGMNVGYIKSPTGGLMKIIQLALCMVCFICASVWTQMNVKNGSGQWVQFVSLSSFILTLVLCILYCFQVPGKVPAHIPLPLGEVIFYGVYTAFYFTSAIVASAFGWIHPSVGAAAFFCWMAFVVFCIDFVLRIMAWRNMTPAFINNLDSSATSSSPPAQASPTSTGPVGPEVKTQY